MSETATVVIVNGVFVNGFVPFEPVYYFKNISGWGSVVRQYPGDFTAYLAGSNEVVGQVLYHGNSESHVLFVLVCWCVPVLCISSIFFEVCQRTLCLEHPLHHPCPKVLVSFGLGLGLWG